MPLFRTIWALFLKRTVTLRVSCLCTVETVQCSHRHLRCFLVHESSVSSAPNRQQRVFYELDLQTEKNNSPKDEFFETLNDEIFPSPIFFADVVRLETRKATSGGFSHQDRDSKPDFQNGLEDWPSDSRQSAAPQHSDGQLRQCLGGRFVII